MKYRITHTTHYHYSQSVGLCQNEARLLPRNFWRQHCDNNRFDIRPIPMDFRERVDFLGNRVTYFAIQQPHTELMVTAISEVTIFPKQNTLDLFNPMTWEQVRSLLQEAPWQGQSQGQQGQSQMQDQGLEILDARQYVLDSPMVTITPELADYAQSSFLPNRPLVDVVHDLMVRIYQDFTYDPTFTTIATPLSEVLSFRRGVCQDFAHLAIGCLRAYGIAVRYISGYVETLPEPGTQRLVGADASHAWFSVYIPSIGWLDFDPTNNTVPLDQHITLAWGRDYSDVTPLKGIAYGGGQHTLSVSVDVLRVE
ncbi:transglutaminase family protein [Methyloglobulus sp.]|uniref:transglutaminase family protein n=1 Tax=Methyloglobulus sp. TaxID=2518622 RepID=UPI00398A2CD7